MGVQQAITSTIGAAAGTGLAIAESGEKESKIKEPKANKQPEASKVAELQAANQRATDALIMAQQQRHQTARVKGLYGARVKAMKKEIAELKGGKE